MRRGYLFFAIWRYLCLPLLPGMLISTQPVDQTTAADLKTTDSHEVTTTVTEEAAGPAIAIG